MNVKLSSRFLAVLALAATAFTAQAQDFNRAQSEIDEKLDASLKELAEVRRSIQEEKAPLSRNVSELQRKVVELRQEQERLQRIQDSRTIDISTLESQVNSLTERSQFINDRLQEFTGAFANRIDYSELPLYEEVLSEAQTAPNNVNLSTMEKRERQLAVVDAALARLADQLGGYSYAGQAYGPDGVLYEGTFISVGPTVYFASSNGQYAGLVEKQLNRDNTAIVALSPDLVAGLPNLAQGGEGVAPLDPTGGRALKVERASKGLLDYVEDGGVIGYVIISLGIVALLLALLKVIEIVSYPAVKPSDIEAVMDDLNKDGKEAAEKRAKKVGGTAGEMLAAGVRFVDEKRGTLEEIMYEKVLKARPVLERFLPFLAITAAAAPLLGLLGTVVGMIKTFNLITIFGTGDAKSLSSGISEALVTTALGLIIAIPTLLLHGTLSRMAKRKIGMLEQGAVAFINSAVSRRHHKVEEDAPDAS